MKTGKKILLVLEDDEDWLSLLEKFLVSQGFAVFTARNCSGAMALLAKARPHCVISDRKLEGEDGAAFCCGLKASQKYRDIPVIVLSGAEPPSCGCDLYVCKTDGLDRLLSAIRKVLPL